MIDDLLGKRIRSKSKTGEIVRVYEVLGSLKNTRRVKAKWDDNAVSTNVRLSDLKILG